jgi:hypothetical protein
VQKQLLKKSALDDYKHNLRQVSHQTIQDRAVCKTQAENVFMDCLTETTGARIERGSGRVKTAQRCSKWRESSLLLAYLLWFVPGREMRCVRWVVRRGLGLMLC